MSCACLNKSNKPLLSQSWNNIAKSVLDSYNYVLVASIYLLTSLNQIFENGNCAPILLKVHMNKFFLLHYVKELLKL